MKVTSPIGAFGAEIEDVDLSSGFNSHMKDELYSLFLKHRLLVIRDQKLDALQLREIGRAFGSLDIHPFIESVPGFPEVIPVVKEASETQNFGGGWHAEVSFYEEPAMATMLYAVETPEVGGDTLVADGIQAYEALPEDTQARIADLKGEHTADHIYGPGGVYENRSTEDMKGTRTRAAEHVKGSVYHPIVRTHPETGEKILYVSDAFVVSIADLPEVDSKPLLRDLIEHVTKAEFVTRIRWRPGTLVMWDNRSTQHYALNDYAGHRREMLRVVVEGDRPV